MNGVNEEKRGFKVGDRVRCVMNDWALGRGFVEAKVGDILIVGPAVVGEEDTEKYFNACGAFSWYVDCFELLTPDTPASAPLDETETYLPGPTHAALNAEPDQSRMVGVVWRKEPW